MAELFRSGLVIDIILALVGVEAIVLAWWLKASRQSISFGAIFGNLLAGFCLLAAVRLAVADAWWGWLALALSASLVAHLFDLRARLTAKP